MKLPKYILDKMEQRKKAGIKVCILDDEIREWIEKTAGVPSYEVLETPYNSNSILLFSEPEALMKGQIMSIEKYEKR